MPFVQKLPEWNKPGTEPPASLKNAGWAATQKPPADYFNWLQYTAYMALKELQEKAQHKDDAVPIQDASITQKGITQLSSAVTSTAEDRAATPNAVKKVNDALNTHKEEFTQHKEKKASATTLGHVKIGANISVSPEGEISIPSLSKGYKKIQDYTHPGGTIASFTGLGSYSRLLFVIYSKYSGGSYSGFRMFLNDMKSGQYSTVGVDIHESIGLQRHTEKNTNNIYLGGGSANGLTYIEIENLIGINKLIKSQSITIESLNGLITNALASINEKINKLSLQVNSSNEFTNGSKVIIYGVEDE